MNDDPWKDILEPEEEILWQGRPDTGFAVPRMDFFMLLFGLLFSGFALVWMGIARLAGGAFWAFGLIHFMAGAGLVLWALGRDTMARRHSYYTLTNRRAIIGLSYPWHKRALHKFPIGARTNLSYDGQRTVTFGARGRTPRHPFPLRAPQFTRIDDASEVFHLMRQIQKETP